MCKFIFTDFLAISFIDFCFPTFRNQTKSIVLTRIIKKKLLTQVIKYPQFQIVPIESTHSHSEYPDHNKVHPNDIALLKLFRNILPSRNAKSIDIDWNENYDYKCNSTVKFFGFGKTFESDNHHNEYWKKSLQTMTMQIKNYCKEYQQNKGKDYIITNNSEKTISYVSKTLIVLFDVIHFNCRAILVDHFY